MMRAANMKKGSPEYPLISWQYMSAAAQACLKKRENFAVCKKM